jgi:deoxyhypusine synthase
LDLNPDFDKFDIVMFDVISGVFQTHKMINFHSNMIPGSYIRGILETIVEEKFFDKIITFGM